MDRGTGIHGVLNLHKDQSARRRIIAGNPPHLQVRHGILKSFFRVTDDSFEKAAEGKLHDMKKETEISSPHTAAGQETLLRFLRRLGAPEPGPEGTTLAFWREMILFALLGTGLLLGLFVAPSSIFVALHEKMWWVAFIDFSFFLIGLGIFFFHGIPYRIRASVTLLLCFGIGFNIIRIVGLLSGGPAWLFAFAVLAGVLLGLRAAFGALLINAVTLFIAGWFIYSGQWPGDVPFFASSKWALLAWVNFLFLNVVAAVPVAVLVRGLESSARKERVALESLREERTRLMEAKTFLDREMEHRQKIEETLLEIGENLNQVIEGSPIASFVIDKNHRVIHWNRACERLTGVPKTRVVGADDHWMAFYSNRRPLMADLILDGASDDDFQTYYKDRWRRSALIPNAYEVDVFIPALGKTGKHLFATAARLVNREGVTIGAVQNVQDVTEEKLVENRLRQSEKRFRDLFNSISDIVYTQDLEGRFLSVNRAMIVSFGYREEEFLGKMASEFMKPEMRHLYQSEYLEKIKSRGFQNGIALYYTKDGRKIYMEYRSALVSPPDGAAYISGSGRDVTERVNAEREIKNLQEQMIQARKMEAVGTLSGGIAHDFNNILGIILGYTELALDDILPENPTRENLEKIRTASLRAREVVKQLLSFSRKTEQQRKPMYLSPIIEESLKLLRPSIPSNIAIDCHIADDLSPILADPTQIHQVILNLCSNAAHAMHENGGELHIVVQKTSFSRPQTFLHHTLKEGDYVHLTVRDTGHGMTPDLLDRIFDPYFTTKEVGKGTGMGLSVVHGIVKAHEGAITVDSAPEKGSSFEVFFPAIQETPVQEEKSTARIPRGTERILLVDDEKFLLEMEWELLKKLGYKVSAKLDPRDALTLFQANPEQFDLVITDMTMPGMTGEKFAAELLKTRADIPIILCTGFSEKMTKERAAALGIKKYLEKPINVSRMAKAVRDVLDQTSLSG